MAKKSGKGKQVRVDEVYSFRLTGDMAAEAAKLEIAFRSLGGEGGLINQANRKSLKWMQIEAKKVLGERMRAHRSNRTGRTGLLEKTISNDNAHNVSSKGFDFMVDTKVKDLMGGNKGKDENRFYAFSLEFGNAYWVGKYLPFSFLGRKITDRKSRNPYDGRGPDTTTDHRSYNRLEDGQAANRTGHRPTYLRGTSARGVQRFDTATHGNVVGDRLIGPREFKTKKSAYIKDARRYKVKINRPVPAYAYGQTAAQRFIDQDVYVTKLFDVFNAFDFETKTGAEVIPTQGKTKARRGKNPLKGRGRNSDVTVIPGNK